MLFWAAAAIVVATDGGAVGVTVNVMISPVTVMTDMNGVGDHVVLLEVDVVLVSVVVGVIGVIGVVAVAAVVDVVAVVEEVVGVV